MARRDREVERLLRREGRKNYSKSMQRYHSIVALHHELRTYEDKRILVDEHPQEAAEVLCYFKDAELGKLFVSKYITHPEAEFRQLANNIKESQTRRESLAEVLDMRTIVEDPSIEDDREAYLEYALSARDR